MVKAWKETVVIPTYEPGKPEKYPMFLEKRVYQGSSGVVYPYAVTESVADVKTDREWHAVFIENEYIKVMVLPELGGRIQMAYDKIRQRHFVYYNHVIKPALVGLAGPWISGGIEFNWPQHHRPSTFMAVDCSIEEHSDGSVTVWVSEMERMFHQKGMAGFTLRPRCAYLEIKGVLFNRTELPQTFLWWANPAVAVNDYYQSVFPPDINAVFDHGKRAVSSFPIATGTYYKMDYSAGVDISNYRNIKVPTSYMGVNSRFDFEGGYENDTRAGMLHVASHHVSPGKKQWTWGNGDFGRAWDRNLTDDDGPYIELMAGVFTENQPDFSWLMPYETKEFTQYFMPYRELGIVKNATKDLIMNIEPVAPAQVCLKLLATSALSVTIRVNSDNGKLICEEEAALTPEAVYERTIDIDGYTFDSITAEFYAGSRLLMSWHAEPDEIRPVPDAAQAALSPDQIKTVEQLYLTGLHLEQYRHATFSPVDYYEEALRRDPDDVRCNNALGLWYIRKGCFDIAERYLRRAVLVSMRRNPNPYDGEPIYNLGVALKYSGHFDEAYDRFYKATWNGAWQDAAFFECAQISAMRGNIDDALYEVDRSLFRNWLNPKARALKSALLLRAGRPDEAADLCCRSLEYDNFNYGCLWVQALMGAEGSRERLVELMHGNCHNYDETALDFCAAGLWHEARSLWETAIEAGTVSPMTYYYLGFCILNAGYEAEATRIFVRAAQECPDYCFPNRLEAILALRAAIKLNPTDANARLFLGNLFYDKRRYDLAIRYWEESASLNEASAMVWRNLALAAFNKQGDADKALAYMKHAFELDASNARILMEYDLLRKRLGHPAASRLAFLRSKPDLVDSRDDLALEFITLLNLTGEYNEALKRLEARTFHPWEGGEGKVSAQYQTASTEQAKKLMRSGDYDGAVVLLEKCLVYPPNLGEGKLFGAQENDFYYLLGVCHRLAGRTKKADECFRKATEGPIEPAASMYYNDARPDKIFYAGAAFRALGLEDKARSYFNRLDSYGRQHYHDKVRMDYFAVSLPDLLIWDGDLDEANRVHCLYMLALGALGLGNVAKATERLAQVTDLAPGHQGAMAALSFIDTMKTIDSYA